MPKNPFFFAAGSLLLRILEMEKLVEVPAVFDVGVDLTVSRFLSESSSPVLINGKQVIVFVGAMCPIRR